jgi:hypothetical protein
MAQLKSHCVHGHALTPGNISLIKGKKRRCRTCRNDVQQRYYATHRTERIAYIIHHRKLLAEQARDHPEKVHCFQGHLRIKGLVCRQCGVLRQLRYRARHPRVYKRLTKALRLMRIIRGADPGLIF